jgi:DNA (cytosine-5)-methyltransferase 1
MNNRGNRNMRITYGSDCTGLDAPYIALSHVFKGSVDNIFASDIDQSVRDMLKANHHIKNIYNSASDRPSTYTDIYFAGFPCQSFSTAGSRKGFDDIRGTVFFDIFNHLTETQPKVVILENVKGILTHDGGATIATILYYLESLGCYNIQHRVLSPHTHGNWPQYRPRVFIVCIHKTVQKREFQFPPEVKLTNKVSSILNRSLTGDLNTLTEFEYNNLKEHQQNMRTKGEEIMDDYYILDIGASVAFGKPRLEVSPTLKASRSNYFITKLKRKLTVDEIRKIQGLPVMKIVVSERQYMKEIGNSICIPVLIQLFKAILQSVNLLVNF